MYSEILLGHLNAYEKIVRTNYYEKYIPVWREYFTNIRPYIT